MFGIPYENLDLAQLPQYPSEIPAGLLALKQFLVHNKGLTTDGIFRLAGDEQDYLDAMQGLDMGESIHELGVSVAVVAQLIKAWFREYPLNTPGFFSVDLLKCGDDEGIVQMFDEMDEPHRSLVLWLIDLCCEVKQHEEQNRMDFKGLAICFSPNFVRNEDAQSLLQFQRYSQALFTRLCILRSEDKLKITDFDSLAMTQSEASADAQSGGAAAPDAEESEEKTTLENVDSASRRKHSLIRKRRRQQKLVYYASSVAQLYRPSLNSGVFGIVNYPTRETYQKIRRSSAVHSKEIVLQAIGVQHDPCFRLNWLGDDTDENEVKLDITETETDLLKSFAKLLSEHHNYENVPRSECLRYVIGCKHRLNVAERRFLNLKAMERQFRLADIQLHQVREELKKSSYLLAGKDKLGRAIIGFKISEFNPNETFLSTMMKSILTLADALSSDVDILRNGIVMIFDMSGLNRDNFSFDLEKVFLKLFQDAYPLRMKQFIIVNAPLLIRGVINVAKPFLTKKLRQRIVSVQSTSDQFWQYVDRSQVPQCVGGTFDKNMDGTYPTNAWQFVVSKVVGDLPDIPLVAVSEAPIAQPPSGIGNQIKGAVASRAGDVKAKFGRSLTGLRNRISKRVTAPTEAELKSEPAEDEDAEWMRRKRKSREYKKRKSWDGSPALKPLDAAQKKQAEALGISPQLLGGTEVNVQKVKASAAAQTANAGDTTRLGPETKEPELSSSTQAVADTIDVALAPKAGNPATDDEVDILATEPVVATSLAEDKIREESP